MRKIIFILLFLPLFGSSQNWADSLAKLERRWSKKTYGWFDSLSTSNRLAQTNEWFRLKIKASIQERLNQTNDSTANVNSQASARQQYIQHLKSLGYLCDNSKADWRKAYNKPEWFGINHQAKADAAWAASTGLNDFLDFCRQYNY